MLVLYSRRKVAPTGVGGFRGEMDLRLAQPLHGGEAGGNNLSGVVVAGFQGVASPGRWYCRFEGLPCARTGTERTRYCPNTVG